MIRVGAATLALGLVLVTGTAAAQGAATDADRLFEEALKLLAAGKINEACAKFEASHAVDPAPGALLALADCQEKAGKPATAYRSFGQAAELARRVGDTKRAQEATNRATALEPKVPYLKIDVTPSDAPVTVRRDGVTVEPALYGHAVPLDPAAYAIDATAPGLVDWHAKADVQAPGVLTITVPRLLPAPPATPPKPAVSAPPARTDEKPTFTTQKKLALGAGVLGVVGLGLGGFFAASAASDWSAAKQACIGDEDLRCVTPQGSALGRDAGKEADIATALSIVGVVALGAAVVLWVTDR